MYRQTIQSFQRGAIQKISYSFFYGLLKICMSKSTKNLFLMPEGLFIEAKMDIATVMVAQKSRFNPLLREWV